MAAGSSSEPPLKKRRLASSVSLYSWRAEAKKNLKAEIQRLMEAARDIKANLTPKHFLFQWGKLGPTVEHGITESWFGMFYQPPRINHGWDNEKKKGYWYTEARYDNITWVSWFPLPFAGKIAALRLANRSTSRTGETGRNIRMLEKRLTREHWKVHDRLVQLKLPHSLAALIVCYTGY